MLLQLLKMFPERVSRLSATQETSSSMPFLLSPVEGSGLHLRSSCICYYVLPKFKLNIAYFSPSVWRLQQSWRCLITEDDRKGTTFVPFKVSVLATAFLLTSMTLIVSVSRSMYFCPLICAEGIKGMKDINFCHA